MNLNQVTIIGRMTRTPELKALPSGIKMTQFSVATNYVGKEKERVDFHNIVVFNVQAETCVKYLKKGQLVLVQGRLQNSSWEDKESGAKRYRTDIIASRVTFGPKAADKDDASTDGDPSPKVEPATKVGDKKKVVSTPSGIEYPEEEINPDDIPF